MTFAAGPWRHRVRLRLFKLRVFDVHCHVVASHDDRDEAIDAPGVDLRGADARAAFEAAEEFFALLRQRGAGADLRAVSVHLEKRRILATFETQAPDETPSVFRIDDGDEFEHLAAAAGPVIRYLSAYAAARLAARRQPDAEPGLV